MNKLPPDAEHALLALGAGFKIKSLDLNDPRVPGGTLTMVMDGPPINQATLDLLLEKGLVSEAEQDIFKVTPKAWERTSTCCSQKMSAWKFEQTILFLRSIRPIRTRSWVRLSSHNTKLLW